MELRPFVLPKTLPLPFSGKWGKLLSRPAEEAFDRPRASTPSRMISVIIPAHNEQQYLAATLEALREQSYGWFEVIVVANGCTDATVRVARNRCQRLIVLSRKNLGMARNLGAKMAKGDILLFLDADTVLEPKALRRIAEQFTSEFAAGTVRGVPDNDRLCYKMLYGLKNLVHKSQMHPGSSGVIICWKDHFLNIGGFDEGLQVRENSELMRRLKRFGRYRYIENVAATTSMRRYDQKGIGRMTWLWLRLWVTSWLGDLHQRQYEAVR